MALVVPVFPVVCGTVKVVLGLGEELWTGEPVFSGGARPKTVLSTGKGGVLCAVLVSVVVVALAVDSEPVTVDVCGTAEGVEACTAGGGGGEEPLGEGPVGVGVVTAVV